MATKVLKSTIDNIGFDFPAALEEHRQALLKHRYTVNEPAPTAHPWVEQCINRVKYPPEDGKPDDFIADYEVVDDTPPPPPAPSFEEQKQRLIGAVAAAEGAYLLKIDPMGKRRLTSMKYADAKSIVEDKRSPADNALIEEYEERAKRVKAINWMAAEMMAEVEDLTPETIDSWVMKPFK